LATITRITGYDSNGIVASLAYSLFQKKCDVLWIAILESPCDQLICAVLLPIRIVAILI
jgi:hypothetical protein